MTLEQRLRDEAQEHPDFKYCENHLRALLLEAAGALKRVRDLCDEAHFPLKPYMILAALDGEQP